jgi:hypothetical protein
MDKIFLWMNAPDTSISETDWAKFLSEMAAVTIVAIIFFVALTVFLYWRSARARKIYSPGDVFKPYTPMRWIALAMPAGAIVSGICVVQYLEPARHVIDILSDALQIGGIIAGVTAGMAYLFIAFMPGITPAKFVYRAAPFRAGK